MHANRMRRTNILAQMRNSIMEAGEKDTTINEESFIAEICMSTGISRRTCKEYIDTLVNSRSISRYVSTNKKIKELFVPREKILDKIFEAVPTQDGTQESQTTAAV